MEITIFTLFEYLLIFLICIITLIGLFLYQNNYYVKKVKNNSYLSVVFFLISLFFIRFNMEYIENFIYISITILMLFLIVTTIMKSKLKKLRIISMLSSLFIIGIAYFEGINIWIVILSLLFLLHFAYFRYVERLSMFAPFVIFIGLLTIFSIHHLNFSKFVFLFCLFIASLFILRLIKLNRKYLERYTEKVWFSQ